MELRKRKVPRYTMYSLIIVNHGIARRAMSWTSESGNVTPLKTMNINHLKNAIAKIKRGHHPKKESFLPTLELELIYRETEENHNNKIKTKHGKKRSLEGIG